MTTLPVVLYLCFFRVENDVKLLRNRVRMLQMEHEKAQKKIQETAKKTDELITLRKRNDERFMRVSYLVSFLTNI